MKKLILLSLMVLSIETLYGQGFQIGLNAGPGIQFRNEYFDRRQEQPTVNNELSIICESKKHFALELGLRHSYYQCNYTEIFNWDCFDNMFPTTEINHVKEKTTRISPIISFLYRFHNMANYNHSINRLSASIGFQMAPCWTNRQYIKNDEPVSSFSANNKEATIMMGLTSRLSYKLSNSWSLSCNINAITDPWLLFGYQWSDNENRFYSSDINFILLLGVNYKL